MALHAFDIFPAVMFFISFYGLAVSENIIKSIVFTMVMSSAVVLFWLGVGARVGTLPPIILDTELLYDMDSISDPLPQALMITAIIIGVSVATVAITMLNNLIRKYNTAEWTPMRQMALAHEDKD